MIGGAASDCTIGSFRFHPNPNCRGLFTRQTLSCMGFPEEQACQTEAYMTIDEIIENFELLDDWEDRYKYLIELGDQLEPFPAGKQDAAHKVQGCVSQVWIDSEAEGSGDPVIHYRGTSDAHIVRGLIAVTLALFSDRKASEIVKTDHQAVFDRLGLAEHITPQRSNGLRSMVQRVKDIAAAQLAG